MNDNHSLPIVLEAHRRHRVGELVDFAQSIPRAGVEPMLATLHAGLRADSNRARRRRKLVLLGILTERLIFEIEGIPKTRNAVI